ncbi:MAG: 3-hydroxyacyl-CoA dehydrogenase family protein [Deltaproteobacteria bacterium]|nr:3-hydroxyacyl-CoA dehydrogenase family protein [Deltaproteobacteria bacterium]
MKIGIAGATSKGTELVKIFSQAGLDVLLMDSKREALETATADIRKALEQTSSLMERVQISQDRKALSKNDWILSTMGDEETISLFKELEESTEAYFASTSATLAVTKLSRSLKKGERVVGLHFIEPVAHFKFVEIVRGVLTSSEAMGKGGELVKKIGFHSVTAHDFPGFLIYRVVAPMINEAIFALYEGLAPAEEIDRALNAVTGQPVGPLALADEIGLDTLLSVLKEMQSGNPKFTPCPLLSKYVEAGYTGRKAGKGFYDHRQPAQLNLVVS